MPRIDNPRKFLFGGEGAAFNNSGKIGDLALFPGSLFFVNSPESPWMRFNMGYSNDKRLFQYFAERLPVLQKMTSTEFSRPTQKSHATS